MSRNRYGFVSNSSSCSFIMRIPEDSSVLEFKNRFQEWFGIKYNDPWLTRIMRGVRSSLEEDEKDRYRKLLQYLNDVLSSEDWDYAEYTEVEESMSEEAKTFLKWMMDDWKKLLYIEIGNSCEYGQTPDEINGDWELVEELGSISTAPEKVTKNCLIFNNH